MSFTDKEFSIITDTEFLLTKAKVISKVSNLLEITREHLVNVEAPENLLIPKEAINKVGKISRGENYNNLPFLVLDYPSLFTKENVFAFRTMFWWGNFFSATLHLEGESLETFRDVLYKNINNLIEDEVYFCINETPWQYHYGKDNYEILSKKHLGLIKKKPFIKISKRISLSEYQAVPTITKKFYNNLIKTLSS